MPTEHKLCHKHEQRRNDEIAEFEKAAKERRRQEEARKAAYQRAPFDCPDCEREYQEKMVH